MSEQRRSFYTFIFRTMAVNKKRCLFAALGILIGILAVTTLVSLGRSTELSLNEELEKLGTNVLIIEAAKTQTAGRNRPSQGATVKTLTEDDLLLIRESVNGLSTGAPVFQTQIDIRSTDQTAKTTLYATRESFFSIRNLELATGRFFTENDDQTGQRVALLGQTVAEQLFGAAAFPGENIRINNVFFEVVGILEGKGLDAEGDDLDDLIIVPLTVAQKRLTSENHLTHIFLQVDSTEFIPRIEEQTNDILRTKHELREGDPSDFTILNQTELLEAQTDILGALSDFITILAIVIILAGSLGITAVQLISLRERSWEIGLHRALGATKGRIATMFLTEALTIGSAAGLIGVVLGLFTSVVLASIFAMPSFIAWQTILLSFMTSIAASLLGGLYPAYHAAHIDPSEALRL